MNESEISMKIDRIISRILVGDFVGHVSRLEELVKAVSHTEKEAEAKGAAGYLKSQIQTLKRVALLRINELQSEQKDGKI